MHGKRKFIIALLVLSCLLFNACGKKSLESKISDLNHVKSISVTMRPPESTIELSEEQIDEVVNILKKVTIGQKDDSYRELNGQWVEYDITYKDGSSISVASFNPYIVIDGVGYETAYEACEELNSYANSLLEGDES